MPISDFNVSSTWRKFVPSVNQIIPDGCELVHTVQHHGARYPTSGETAAVFVDWLQESLTHGMAFPRRDI